MTTRIISWLTLAFFYIPCSCQEIDYFTSNTAYQYGVAAKLSIELAEYKKLTFRFGFSAGIGREVINNGLYFSLHSDIMFYNNGFGSPKSVESKIDIVKDFLVSGTLTAGGYDRMRQFSRIRPGKRNDPLYYFSNFTRPPLQNPYNYSLSLGSNLVFNPDHKFRFQQVGFLNVHIAQFQASYFNDGTPFQYILLGDGRDRYYTGGGIITFTLPAKNMIDNLELSYAKYSGYTPGAFEIANLLDLSFLNYGDNFENAYNKSMFTFTAASSTHHFQLAASAFNQTEWDIQHRIHQHIFNVFHRVPHKAYYTPRISLYISNTKIGLQ